MFVLSLVTGTAETKAGNLFPTFEDAALEGEAWLFETRTARDGAGQNLEITYRVREATKAELAAERDAEISRYRTGSEYGHLTQSDGTYSGTLAGKNIRAQLRRAYPDVSFSVRSKNGSVDIRWTDGPTSKTIERLVSPFRGGHYNAMEEYYSPSDSAWGDVFGSARYIFTQREHSAAHIERAIGALWERYPGNFTEIARPTAAQYEKGALYVVIVPGLGEDLQSMISKQASADAWPESSLAINRDLGASAALASARDRRYLAAIAGRMSAEQARDVGDAEIERCLAACVAGQTLIPLAKRLRRSQLLSLSPDDFVISINGVPLMTCGPMLACSVFNNLSGANFEEKGRHAGYLAEMSAKMPDGAPIMPGAVIDLSENKGVGVARAIVGEAAPRRLAEDFFEPIGSGRARE